MPADQLTPPQAACQEPFRWTRADITGALHEYSTSDPPSQRGFARQHGVPPTTFNSWVRSHSPDNSDPVDSFFRSPAGESVLRRITLSALAIFHERGACGIRFVGDFLDLSGLGRYVASSRGALHPLAARVESDLAAFAVSEQPALARQMGPRSVTLVLDEHFHGPQVCLVGIEPVSDFILVECYRDGRDADTWKQAIDEATAGMPVEVIQVTSDQAAALLCCAEEGLHAAHSPDLFHGQHDLLKPILLPLARPIQQAQKDLEQVRQQIDKLDGPLQEPWSAQEFHRAVELVRREKALQGHREEAQGRKDAALGQVRGIGDDYHPFDRRTGAPVSAEEVGKRLCGHLDELEGVVQEAGLNEEARRGVQKSRAWAGVLVGCVAWFWDLVQARVEELGLSEGQERVVCEKLLAGHYWEKAAGRARTSQERGRLKAMAERLKEEAWREGGALSSLPAERREGVDAVAQECAGLFQRSSSCVEGRNGRLSLQHHGHSRVSERRLKALTVLHNYLVRRPDGTTAAQRFFRQPHKDLFAWLLERMPELPRPAPKRSKTPADGPPAAG